MRLIIDGYNLIHTVPELAFASDKGQGREALMEALRLYRKRRSHKIKVVFDGGLEPGGAKERLSGMPVSFSGAERSADDVIAALAAKEGGGITVVTSDRELAGRCRVHGAVVLSSEEFGNRLLEVALGMPAGAGGDEDGWDFTTKKKGPAKRLPKAERKKARRKDRL
ncbi:MAG: NYN domain-containing protein [Desulfarculaceae bacterium]|nr:NYN domain-containing protein [Desulfarculaceae bacterium]MCF8046340.1 NYN domain-containing protein [Desulfarculaceae bacterium]MCF8063710.1 NYN domain-containing protein [Desulfarculaceae bacterium]MCF8121592.1 NYN domain-containing protein [Desulfarculaceae bacterium]